MISAYPDSYLFFTGHKPRLHQRMPMLIDGAINESKKPTGKDGESKTVTAELYKSQPLQIILERWN